MSPSLNFLIRMIGLDIKYTSFQRNLISSQYNAINLKSNLLECGFSFMEALPWYFKPIPALDNLPVSWIKFHTGLS
jgi:hypothetical protein